MTEEYVLKDTGKLEILNFKPNYNIYFHRGNEKVGVLDFNGPEMKFSGDMDESAKLFLELVATSFKARLEQERAVGYREGHQNALKQMAQPEQHQDWCASLTQMLMSTPPKPALCNCKPKPEPMAWTNKMSIDVPNQPLYTAPQRTWVGLTLDERLELAEDVDWPAGAYCEYAEKIEAKLKEKNT